MLICGRGHLPNIGCFSDSATEAGMGLVELGLHEGELASEPRVVSEIEQLAWVDRSVGLEVFASPLRNRAIPSRRSQGRLWRLS